jgi:plasmid stabilization system protein ParE
MDELKWSDDDIRQLREAVNHLLEINEELNAKVIAMDAYVKNGDAKIRAAQRYINQLEQIIESFTIQNHN